MGRRSFNGIGVIVAVLVVVLFASCGHSRQAHNTLVPKPIGTDNPTDTLEGSLQQELDALEVPDGVDPALFDLLKSELTRALEQRSKEPSKAPSGTGNQINDLSWRDNGSGGFELAWHYRNLGDYNQDGCIGVTDVTPLAIYFGARLGENPVVAAIDGDGNGIVGIGDITPLAQNFCSSVTEYVVYTSEAEDGEAAERGRVPFEDGTTEDGGPKEFTYPIYAEDIAWFSVGPEDGTGNPGQRSMCSFFMGPEVPPEIISVSPAAGLVNHEVTFEAVVSGMAPITYAWDFGGGAEPNTTSDESPVVTLGAEGEYTVSLTVTNAYGEDTYEFTLTTSIWPPEVLGVSPLLGVVGSQKTFHATVDGEQPMTYTWDFGGGAEPNTSDEKYPDVILGAEGVYDANVHVENEYGGVDYPFTLSVGYPPIVTEVTPVDGQAWSEVQFTPTVTGTVPLTYAWDFGGGADPNTSSDESPTVTLNDGGHYSASLTVTNLFGQETFDFDLAVNSDWAHTWGDPDLDSEESGRYVVVDNEGNVFLTQSSALLKYDRQGTLLYSRKTDGLMLTSIAIGEDGLLYLGGCDDTFDLDTCGITMCVDDAGNNVWQTAFGIQGNEEYLIHVSDVLRDDSSVYTVGTSYNSAFIIKMDGQGNISWSKAWPEAGWDGDEGGYPLIYVTNAAQDDEGNVFISGGFQTSTPIPPTDVFEKSFLLKCSPDGQVEWYKIWTTDFQYGFSRDAAVAVDAEGFAYVAYWYTYDENIGSEIGILKFDTQGEVQWSKRWGVAADEEMTGEGAVAFSIALTSDGRIVISGEAYSKENVGLGKLLLLTCDTDGDNFSGIIRADGYCSVRGINGIDVDQHGNLYVTGCGNNPISEWIVPEAWSGDFTPMFCEYPLQEEDCVPVVIDSSEALVDVTGDEDNSTGAGDALIVKRLLE